MPFNPRFSFRLPSGMPRRPLYVCILFALFGQTTVCANEPVEFDTGFLRSFGGTNAGPALDLNSITRSNVGPGTYPVILRLNQGFFDRRELRFDLDPSTAQLRPCLSDELLEALGVKLAAFTSKEVMLPACIDLEALIPGSSVTFDGGNLTLDISVPQIALHRNAAGYVASGEWDAGINAAMLNYQFSTAQAQRTDGGTNAQYSLYLNGGGNLGDWRLRSSASLRHDAVEGMQWQRSRMYAQRDLPGAWGTLTLGESVTPGDVFSSMPFRGVQLASDLGMLPDSMQGYAPIIRGIAQTQAKVEVRQNGYSLYTTYVAPGAFEIDDLNAANGNGDLEVIITEADGREQRFTQPFATIGTLLREKALRYSLTAGEYGSATDDQRPGFAQASLGYGLPFDFTLYGGLLGSGFYQSLQVGVGKNLGNIGAVSLDVTQARTTSAHGTVDKGQSYGLRYGKAFTSGTSVRFAGYRYSTAGYRDFGEAVLQQQPQAYSRTTKRNEVEASVAQSLGGYGSLYLSMSQQSYWGSREVDRQLQLGFNTQYRGVGFGVYASKSLSSGFDSGNQVMFNVSVPIGGTRASSTFSMTRNSDGSLDQRAGLSGRSGERGELTYNVNASRPENHSNSGSAVLGYRAAVAQLGAGVSVGHGYRQASFSAAGSVLAHADGVEFGHTLGETVALVEIKDTPNVGLFNAPGALTNDRGYVVQPYATPYRRNRVAIDTRLTDTDVDIEDGITHVVPRRGAVVKARFNAARSEKAVVNVSLADGSKPPFGASVRDAQGANVGVVAQAGQVLLVLGDVRTFTLLWGAGEPNSCQLNLESDSTPVTDGYRVINTVCKG